MRNVLSLSLAVICAACTLTRPQQEPAPEGAGGMETRFNDGDESWDHLDDNTGKTGAADGEAETTTTFDKLAVAGAGAAAEKWLKVPIDKALFPGAGKLFVHGMKFVMSELLNAPPPALALPAEGNGGVYIASELPVADYDDVHGFVIRLAFDWNDAYMEDHAQSGLDAGGKRELTLRVRAYGQWRDVPLTTDSNECYGWIACEPWRWPRGKAVRLAVYDADFALDDGMVDWGLSDVHLYYLLAVTYKERRYTVGKVGFLSESDVALMREKYVHLEILPGR